MQQLTLKCLVLPVFPPPPHSPCSPFGVLFHSDRYILFSLAFMVLIASENSIVKAVKDGGDEYVAWLLEQIVLVGGGIVWVLVHLAILVVYCAPDLVRRKWSQINVVY